MNIERWLLNYSNVEDVAAFYNKLYSENTVLKIVKVIDGLGIYRQFIHSIEPSLNKKRINIMFDQELPASVFDQIHLPYIYWFGGIVLIDVENEH